jgi:hypothetical protein
VYNYQNTNIADIPLNTGSKKMMRRILTIWLLVLGVSLLQGQTPQLLNYQGKLVDATGNALNGTYSLEFIIYDLPENGTNLWSEVHSNVGVSNGFFNVLLGSVSPFPTDLFSGSGERYLEIVVGAEILAPRFHLTSVAYAIRAAEADNVADGSVNTAKLADGAVTQEKLDAGVTTAPSGASGGDLSGAYPNPTVIRIQRQAVSAVAPADGQVLKWNATNTNWEPGDDLGGAPSGDAGGDLGGTYPNPAVVGLQGRAVTATAPTSNQVLKWNGSAWAPAAESGGDTDWSIDGNDIYHLTGNVSIGTSVTNSKLNIDDATTAGSGLNVTKTAGQAVSAIRGHNTAAPPSGFINSGGVFTADADAVGGKYGVQGHARGTGVILPAILMHRVQPVTTPCMPLEKRIIFPAMWA